METQLQGPRVVVERPSVRVPRVERYLGSTMVSLGGVSSCIRLTSILLVCLTLGQKMLVPRMPPCLLVVCRAARFVCVGRLRGASQYTPCDRLLLHLRHLLPLILSMNPNAELFPRLHTTPRRPQVQKHMRSSRRPFETGSASLTFICGSLKYSIAQS